jgi:hypothetical protein
MTLHTVADLVVSCSLISPRDVWQDAFDKAQEGGCDPYLCSALADSATSEYIAIRGEARRAE